jgi:uncharacterized protein
MEGAMGKFSDNQELERFELEEDGAISFAAYRDDKDGRRALLHFETPEALRGRGSAGRLMAEIVAQARATGGKLRALCPYAVSYLEKHPNVADVLE